MREILFRGQRTYNGKWVEGYIARNAGMPLIIPDNGLVLGAFRAYEVIPETVGQFTGLTDQNGKQIFEGDIVSHKGQIYEIKYSTKQARFLALLSNGVFNPVVMQNCEVIGNVHDNPELIREKENVKI